MMVATKGINKVPRTAEVMKQYKKRKGKEEYRRKEKGREKKVT